MKHDYKEYDYPYVATISYTIASIIGSFLAYRLVGIFNKEILAGYETDFLVSLITLLLFLVPVLIGVCVISKILPLNTELCRGLGFHAYMIWFDVGYILLFIIFILLQKYALGNPLTFFGVTSTAIVFLVPSLLNFALNGIREDEIGCCITCGIMGAYDHEKENEVDLGTNPKFHNEGGYYEDSEVKTSFSANNNDYSGDARTTFRTYVPKTTVYDGLYNKKKIKWRHTCCVCGRYYFTTEEKETRVD